MKIRWASLPLLAALPLLLSACVMDNPFQALDNPFGDESRVTMGPESARYVPSRYRNRFGPSPGLARAAAPSHAAPAYAATPTATSTSSATPTRRTGRSLTATPTPGAHSSHRSARPAPPTRPAPPVRSTTSPRPSPTPSIATRTVTPTRSQTSHSMGMSGSMGGGSMTTSRSHSMSTPSSAMASTRPPVATPNVAAARRSTPTPTTHRRARKFLRLKVEGMSNPESDPFTVRKQLSSAPGVKEVVLSFKTRTAIVVIGDDADPDVVMGSLRAPYSASVLN